MAFGKIGTPTELYVAIDGHLCVKTVCFAGTYGNPGARNWWHLPRNSIASVERSGAGR